VVADYYRHPEITEGRHYLEVELLSESLGMIFVGISRPNLDPTGKYFHGDCTDGWFIYAAYLRMVTSAATASSMTIKQAPTSRAIVWVCFFKNGVQHGPGYPAGSVAGPVVHAVQMLEKDAGVRVLPNAEAPADM
jgi:hypothetical protein